MLIYKSYNDFYKFVHVEFESAAYFFITSRDISNEIFELKNAQNRTLFLKYLRNLT